MEWVYFNSVGNLIGVNTEKSVSVLIHNWIKIFPFLKFQFIYKSQVAFSFTLFLMEIPKFKGHFFVEFLGSYLLKSSLISSLSKNISNIAQLLDLNENYHIQLSSILDRKSYNYNYAKNAMVYDGILISEKIAFCLVKVVS